MPFLSSSLLIRRGNGPPSLGASYTMGANGCSQRPTLVFLLGNRVDGGPQGKWEIRSWLTAHPRTEGSLKVTLSSLGQNRKLAFWYLSLSQARSRAWGHCTGTRACNRACPASDATVSRSGLLFGVGFYRFGL